MFAQHIDGVIQDFFKQDLSGLSDFDFHDAAAVAALRKAVPDGAGPDQTVADLKAIQRVLRLTGPAAKASRRLAARAGGATPNAVAAAEAPTGVGASDAKALLDSGFDSAHKITLVARRQFVDAVAPKLGDGGEARAGQIYSQAVSVKAGAAHLLANAAALTASPHFQAMAVNQVPAETTQFFEALPGYDEMFGGTLDYCECSECKSIFGAAAYLVDLLRLIDKAVTGPNSTRKDATKNIPAGYSFNERRPDIAGIPLTCEKTNGVVPYLRIVNEILAGTVGRQSGGGDPYLKIANAYYPFALPFNRPLEEIRAFLAAGGTSLSEVFNALDPGENWGADAAREYLNISLEEMANFKPPDASHMAAVVKDNYGIAVADGNLGGLDRLDTFAARTGLTRDEVMSLLYQNLGPRELFDVAGDYKPSDRGTKMTLRQSGGRVTGTYDFPADLKNGTLDGVIQGNVVRGHWQHGTGQAAKGDAGSFEFTFAADASSFTGKWSKGFGGDWEKSGWNGARNAAAPAAPGSIPHQFFINQTLAANKYLGVSLNTTKPDDTYEQINNLSPAALYSLSLFIRLARKLGWSYADLDWALTTLGATALSGGVITELAKVERLSRLYDLPLDLLLSLWFDIRTTGAGPADDPAAPFDLIFNSADRMRRTPDAAPYHPQMDAARSAYVNPLYKDTVLRWMVAADPKAQPDLGQNAPTADELQSAKVIVSSVPASGDDVAAIALQVFGAGPLLALDVPNLSALYRHAVLPRRLGIKVAEYLVLLRLLGLFEPGQQNKLLARSLTRDQVLLVCEAVAWMRKAGLNVYDADYICNATPSTYVNPGYDPTQLVAFLNSLQPGMKGALLNPGSFAGEGITADASAAYFARLTQDGTVDAAGLVLGRPDADAMKVLLAQSTPAPTAEQAAYVASLVSAQQAQQAQQAARFNQQLASFFGVRGDVMAVLVAGVSAALAAPAYLENFVLLDLFESDPAAVLAADGSLDPKKLPTLFAALKPPVTLSDTFAIQPQTPGAWVISDQTAKRVYYAMTGDDGRVRFSQPASNLAPAGVTAGAFVGLVSQYLKLSQDLGLDLAELSSVFAFPQVYEIEAGRKPPTLTLTNLRNVFWLKQLVAKLGDRKDALVSYLTQVHSIQSGVSPQPPVTLHAASGWEAAQCEFLCGRLFPGVGGCDTVPRLRRLAGVFDIAASLGVDVFFLDTLGGLKSKPAADNWDFYTNMALTLLQALKSRTQGPAWAATFERIDNRLNERTRDALAPLAVLLLSQANFPVADVRGLYEFLLVDVEMSGCAEISYIREALNAAQLYLQRCRLSLEPNVTISTDDIPDVYWEWMMSYRVWEANRKVFLYPENYIDPSLRTTKTALFKALENTLTQGEVTKETVADAYRKYLDDFAELAKLKYVDAYHCTVHDAQRGAIDTLYLFARTQAEPYTFYYISREPGDVWSEWQKIDITVGSDVLTPLYVFNRLFVFWVELKQYKEQAGGAGAGTSANVVVTKAAVKYSFHDFSGRWVQPQTAVPERVINVAGVGGVYGEFDPALFDTSLACWRRVAATVVGARSYGSAAPPARSEKILLSYGPQIDVHAPTGAAPTPDVTKDSASVIEFKTTVAAAMTEHLRAFAVVAGGAVPVLPPVVLNSELEADVLLAPGEQYLFERDRANGHTAAPPLARLRGPSLTLVSAPSSFYRDYFEGTGVPSLPQQPPPLTPDTSSLFQNVAVSNASVIPVRNQPGWLLLTSGGETFLLSGGASDGSGGFPLVTDTLAVDVPYYAVAPDDFVTDDINKATSEKVWQLLMQSPLNVLLNTGVVKKPEALPILTPDLLVMGTANLLNTQQANEVIDVLRRAANAGLSYGPTLEGGAHLSFQTQRLTTGAVHDLSRRLLTGGIDSLLSVEAQGPPTKVTLPFGRLNPQGPVNPPDVEFGEQVSFAGPYGNYYWELFFHAPLLVAKLLNSNQQFADAQNWLRYIFDPTVMPDPVTPDSFVSDDIDKATSEKTFAALADPNVGLLSPAGEVTAKFAAAQPADDIINAAAVLQDPIKAKEVNNFLLTHYLATPQARFWRFLPFRNRTLESLVGQLTNPTEIAVYNEDPFDPHAVARLRVGAYEKAVVMQYVDNLLDWGDSEFSQYTYETITTATMLYAYAYDLLGPRPRDLGPCAASFPAGFVDIQAKYAQTPGGIPQFLIELEQAAGGGSSPRAATPAFNDLDGYFCVPENDQFTAYWDRVEDRLYKIRHCLNIAGQAQPMPLFDPPLDPMALVRAAAAGGNLLDAAALAQPDVPAYRFRPLLEAARGVASTLAGLGAGLLAALEKNDGEALARLHSTHEQAVLNLTTVIKQKQIDGQQADLQALQLSKTAAQYRRDSFQQMIDGGLIGGERAGNVLLAEALVPQGVAVGIHGVAIAGYLAPNIFGFADGGMQFGDAVNMGASIAEGIAGILNQGANLATTMAGYKRRSSDWEYQRQLAQDDMDQLDTQTSAAQARLDSARQELAAHLQQVANAKSEDDFLRSKFTSLDLYSWMVSRLSSVYFQTYRLALDMALAAQTAYRYELDRGDQFITFDYWDNLRKGLLAGESLTLSLEQLERAYLTGNPRRLEIEKVVSLRRQFPAEFLAFKLGQGGAPGRLAFTLDESLYDFDFPGHYCRKIKSVSVSIPAVVGPYQSLNATLVQKHNTVVLKPDVGAINYLLSKRARQTGDCSTGQGQSVDPPGADVLRQDWVPNQQIAVSRGVEDAGVFVLDFNDERYLPFEGTGAVSSWELSLPPETNQLNFDSISDVVVRVQYTALDGGADFAGNVRGAYRGATGQNFLNAKAIDLRQAYPSAWFQLFSAAPAAGKQQLAFPLTDDFVLPNLRGVQLHSLLVQFETADPAGVTQSGFLSFQLNGKPAQLNDIPVTNNFGELCDLSQLSGYPFGSAQCSLTFDVGKSPDGILKEDKTALDPGKLLNVNVVVCYIYSPFKTS